MGASHARGFVAEGANVVIADVLGQEGCMLANELSVPKALGGEGGPGTNPEPLFAVRYAECFHSGLLLGGAGSEARRD